MPKVCGGDMELGNFILDERGSSGATCYEAARALLAEVKGVAHSYLCSGSGSSWSGAAHSYGAGGYAWQGGGWRAQDDAWSGSGGHGRVQSCGSYGSGDYSSQDWGRKFLASNGGCVYIDLGHLEVCLPECLSALEHVAAWHAMLRIVREAQHAANSRLGDGRRIQVLVNNSDGHGNSFGSHLDFLITRPLFDNLFHRKLHQMLYLAAYQASSIVFTGAGKVGSENGRAAVPFQLSQRADHYETLTGEQTTHNRPIVNSRDECLCGPRTGDGADSMARLHVIFYDNTLCHVASFLKVGVMQIVLAMIEQGWTQPGLLLDNPLAALVGWSHDPSLRHKARLVSGKDYTAVEVQKAIAEAAGRFVAAGRAQGLVPGAEDILKLWTETLDQLGKGDFEALAGKLDWVLKKSILQQAIDGNGLDWDAPEVKYLDQMYASLDPQGLYWEMERAGVARRLVTEAGIEHLIHEPPAGTRAHTRAMVLRSVDGSSVIDVDWDEIRLKRVAEDGGYWSSSTYHKLPMHDPLAHNKAQFDSAHEQSADLFESLQRLGMVETTYFGQPIGSGSASYVGGQTALAGPAILALPVSDIVVRDVSTVGLKSVNEHTIEGERHGTATKDN